MADSAGAGDVSPDLSSGEETPDLPTKGEGGTSGTGLLVPGLLVPPEGAAPPHIAHRTLHMHIAHRASLGLAAHPRRPRPVPRLHPDTPALSHGSRRAVSREAARRPSPHAANRGGALEL